MAIKNGIVVAGFVFFALTQFMISLPTTFGLTPYLRSLTSVYEILGLKHRWSLFTHAPGDNVHAWYQVYHIVRIRDSLGAQEDYKLPEYPDGLFDRYARVREFDYIKNLWATKSSMALPLSRFHARLFLAKHPSAVFPLKAEILQSFQKIRRPFSAETIGSPRLDVLHALTLSGEGLCEHP